MCFLHLWKKIHRLTSILGSAPETIRDLDWTATPDNQSILAVGFAHRIELLCQQRATYFDETPGWGICWKVDIGRYDRFSLARVALTEPLQHDTAPNQRLDMVGSRYSIGRRWSLPVHVRTKAPASNRCC